MNAAPIHTLLEKDIAQFFGVAASDLSQEVRAMIKKSDFRYRRLETHERDDIILTILKRIESPTLGISGVDQKERWIQGWNENLDMFVKSGYEENSLIPKFIRPNQPVRLDGDYAVASNEHFERDFFYVLRRWLYETYLAGANPIFEFGCGTGFNLVELAKMYPDKELHGSDWVDAPKKIIDLIAEKRGYHIKGYVFDMFAPDQSFPLTEGAAVLVVGALEQIGSTFEPFLQFVLSRKPSIVVHVDPFVELYNEDNLYDYLALAHDRKRNYLCGYVTRLRELEKEGKIEILTLQRIPCGGLYHDGYSTAVWRMKV